MPKTLALAAAALPLLAACATTEAPPAAAPERLMAETLPLSVAMPSASLDEAAPVTRLAFGSCNKQYSRQDYWDAIAEADPDLFVFLGDNVYGDALTADPSLPELRAAYYKQAASEPFADLRAEVPVIAVWDDHDFGLNDAGREFSLKAEAERLFEDAWALPPDDPRRTRPGVYHETTLGPDGQRVQIILLDTRYFRSPLTRTDEYGAAGKERYVPSADPDQTYLGETQEAWLEEALSQPADLRILVSSTQVIADGHGWEAWRTHPLARQRLYDQLARAEGRTLIVTGDRHRGGFYALEDTGLLEMTTSSLNAAGGEPEPGPNRLYPTVTEANFGLIELDWTAGEAVLSLRDMEGGTHQAVTVSIRD